MRSFSPKQVITSSLHFFFTKQQTGGGVLSYLSCRINLKNLINIGPNYRYFLENFPKFLERPFYITFLNSCFPITHGNCWVNLMNLRVLILIRLT